MSEYRQMLHHFLVLLYNLISCFKPITALSLYWILFEAFNNLLNNLCKNVCAKQRLSHNSHQFFKKKKQLKIIRTDFFFKVRSHCMLRDANFPFRELQGKWDRTYLKIQAQKTVEELQESENCLRNCKQRMVISGKYLKTPMETDQIIFSELTPLSHIL